MIKQETNWEEKWKNEFSCLFSVYKEVNGKEKRMMEESIKFIKDLLSTTSNEVIKEIEEKMEPPLSWKKAVKSYDPKTKGEYCACCGFSPDNWKSLLNSLKTPTKEIK